MFNKFVAYVLTSFLGDYFDNIDREQIKVSVWNGLVHMRNLRVRQDALRFLDVPVCVLMGTIEELRIIIPWTRLRSESVVVQIRKAQLVIADKETAGYSVDQDVREARARKFRELAATDETLLLAFCESLSHASSSAAPPTSVPSPASAAADSCDDNFTARLKASILNNIRVEVEDLWVHYTSSIAGVTPAVDNVLAGGVVEEVATRQLSQRQPQQSVDSSPPPTAHVNTAVQQSSQQASLSFQIKGLKTCGCNELFEPAFVAPGERMVRQIISFHGLTASLRTSSSRESKIPFLIPFDMTLELAYQPVYTDASTPQYMAAARMKDTCLFIITSETCTTCQSLAQCLVDVRQRQALRRLRPSGVRPTANPHAWWRYALDAVRQQLRKNKTAAPASTHKPTPFSWRTYVSMKQKRDRYMRLYLRQQRTALRAAGWLEPLTVEEHVEMMGLEEELSLDVLKVGKKLALWRVGVERAEYEKLLSEKRAAGGAGETLTTSPVPLSAPSAQRVAPVAKGGWFSFWRSESQPTTVTSDSAGYEAADGLSDEARAELRELVQLMSTKRWTEAQRALIAQEFGISSEEAETFAYSDASLPAPTPDLAAMNLPKKQISHRSVPNCVVFLQAAALKVELQCSVLCALNAPSVPMRKAAPSTPAHATLAQVALHTLQAGVEWGGVSAASPSVLPAAYYWGTMEHFSITATPLTALDDPQLPPTLTEEVILSIGRPTTRQDDSQSNLSSSPQSINSTGGPRTSAANIVERVASVHLSRSRTFSPLESCWSILPDECRRHGAVQVEWTIRSAQQLTSETSALHFAHVGLATVHLVINVVPLSRLSSLFFRVLWPEVALLYPSPGPSTGVVKVRSSPPIASSSDDDFTALTVPVSACMTHAEQCCSTGADAQLILLRRIVEQQLSIDWSVAVDAMLVSLFEVPQVQGCELALTQVCLRNDVVHCLQRQERWRAEVSKDHPNASFSPATMTTAAAPLGSLETDWIDCTHLQIAAVRLSVLFPTTPASVLATESIERSVLLSDTTIAVVVERSLLGRSHPTLPQWNLHISSSNAVSLTWSRTSLSVLTTACSLLADLAASVWSNILQREAAPMDAGQSPEDDAVYTFRVRVLPHPTGKRFWHAARGQQGHADDEHEDDPPLTADERESYYKQLHPFSAARRHSTVVTGAALPQRVDIRPGVCIVYHAQRSTFPAHCYALLHGCTHVHCDGGAKDSGVTAAASVTTGPRVHLYVLQGGMNHEEALESGYSEAKRFLLDSLKVPPALLENAVWLKRAVNAWLEKLNAEEGDKGAPSQQHVKTALSRVLAGTQVVPCRYVAFQCANDAEACAVAAALRRCCVAGTTPPWGLRSSVQTRYNTDVSPPELLKQPLYGVTVSFPLLCMTCEGSEPVLCSDALEMNTACTDSSRSSRRDAVLSFTPFLLCQKSYRDKQRYELRVADRVALYAGFGGSRARDNDLKLLEVSTPSSTPVTDTSSRTAGDACALFMCFEDYKRSSPLPSARRCAVRVAPAAQMWLRAGPALLEWGEAWWDTAGLLTNRLFSEEIISGYPWWRSRGRDEDAQEEQIGEDADVHSRMPTEVEMEWRGSSECGNNGMSIHVDVTVPALQVDLELENAIETSQLSRDIPVLQFRALGAVLQWCLTDACSHLWLSAQTPQLQWCCSSASGTGPAKANWITLMQPHNAVSPSESRVDSAELSVDWKLHKPPPTLSLSDWLRARSGGGEGGVSVSTTGIRDQQELKMQLRCVQLVYWHPLLMHLLQSVLDGLVPRASAVVSREPCWFCAGTLFCPPLSWRIAEKAPVAVSWTHVCTSVTLQSVELQVPRQVDWIAQAASSALLPPTPHLRLSVKRLSFTDRIKAPPFSSTSDLSPATNTVDIVFAVHFSDMVISHAQPSSGASFQWRLPSWHVIIAYPVFDARCLWEAGVPWHKSFAVVLPSLTESCVLQCSSADLAYVMDAFHANFVYPTPFSREGEPHTVNTSSPASLLKAVVEESTWTLDVKGEATFCISSSQSDASHSDSQSMQCLLQLSGAAASAVRSTSGERSYSFAAQQIWLGCGTPNNLSSGLSKSGGRCILQVVPMHSNSAATAPTASLTLQYGWHSPPDLHVGLRGATGSATLPERVVCLSVDSLGRVITTVNGEAIALLLATFVDDAHLRESLLRYVAETPSSGATASIPTSFHKSSDGRDSEGCIMQVVRIRLEHLQCCIPCSAESIYSPGTSTTTPSTALLVLNGAASKVHVELRKNLSASYVMVRVARLLHCVLEDTGGGGSVATVIPLVLEQPTEWQAPAVAASSRPGHHASLQTPVASVLSTGAPRSTDARLLDELVGELPEATSPDYTSPELPEVKQGSALQRRVISPANDVLYMSLDDGPMQCKIILQLQPLWIFSPSMVHIVSMLNGVRTQVKSSVTALLHVRATPALHHFTSTATGPEPPRHYALQLRSESLSVFVGEREVTTPATPSCPSASLEAIVQESVGAQEMLLLVTEAVTVEWDSELQASEGVDGTQTVVHLQNMSIRVLQGMRSSTALLEQLDIRLQRQVMASRMPFESSAAATIGTVEEWRLGVDPLHLTLAQLHYTVLLRLVLQQTSLLATIVKHSSSASQSIAAAAADLSSTVASQGLQQHSTSQLRSPFKARSFQFHLSSLRLRVQADDGADGCGPLTAVYFELSKFDATYYTGQHNWPCVEDVGDVLKERGVSLRLTVTLASCHLGTEGNIPTLALTAASSRTSTQPAHTRCSLCVAQEEATKAYRGALQVGQVTLTVETVPMMAWMDILYTPYLRETVPDYQTAKEHLMQQDWWLAEDLVLSERTPLRVTNKLYSLVYLYGNGYTIHMNATRHGQLIFLDEGVTLRIMHATVCMYASSIEAYVAAGNGSYVVIDRETCSVVPPPSAVQRNATGIRPAEVRGMDQQTRTAAEFSSNAGRELGSPKWHRLVGEVQMVLRIPEPRSVASAAAMSYSSAGCAATTSAQRTLVLYSQMHLCLMNARSTETGEDEMTAAFDLAHAGVRSEYVAHHGGSAVDTSDLVADWAVKVLMTEERRRRAGDSTASLTCTRTIHLSAGTGVEVQVRYSDAVFVARAACHAQAAASRWQDAVRQEVWSGFFSSQRGWDAARIENEASVALLMQTQYSHRGAKAGAFGTPTSADTTVDAISLQIPYVSFVVINDSQDIDTPLFCLYANEIHTPQCTLKALQTNTELRFALQVEYYELSLSHWAPVLEPVEVNVFFTSRKNTSVTDVYDRQGYARLSARTSSVKLYFSLEMLRTVRQLLMLRDMFDSAVVDALATCDTSDGGSARRSTFHTFRLVQTTGIDIAVQLQVYMEKPQGLLERAGGSDNDAFLRGRVLHSGQEWEFNFPRCHGKEVPREHQTIIVQETQEEHPSSAPTSKASGAEVSLAAVGVQRVRMGDSGPLQRYILAEVSVPLRRQGQKQVFLHTLVTFTNRLSIALLQVVLNASGTYDAVGVIPPASSQCVPVQVLRRRVTLALGNSAEASTPSPSLTQMQLSADSIVSLGMSYDSLPCLAGTVFLCVCTSAHGNRSSAGSSSGQPGVARIAVGHNFEVFSRKQDKTHFLLRIQEAARQPVDVLRNSFLSPLRAVMVTAEAVVTIHNAVGVPLMVTLLTRRIHPGRRISLLDTSPDTTVYTQLCSVAVGVGGSYGATEMDPLQDVCLGVSLQQPNGITLAQWSTAPTGSTPTAHHPPACVYTPLDETRRDTQLVLVDPITNATLVLAIRYAQREATLYCPCWIFNETGVPLQLADTTRPHHGNTERCVVPIAGLSGQTVLTATVAPCEVKGSDPGDHHVAGDAQPFLYHSLRAASCNRKENYAGSSGLFLRLWEPAEAGTSGGGAQAGWSDWSSQPLLVDEAAELQVVVCTSRHKRGAVWVLACRVEMGHQASARAYSDTRVVSIRPRWVLVNKSPYALRFAQLSSGVGNRPAALTAQTAPFTETAVSTLVTPAMVGGRLEPLFSIAMCDDKTHNVDQCRWSPPFSIHTVEEWHLNLVYQSSIPLAEHWPQTSTRAGQWTVQGVVDHLPPLCPEDIHEVGGELFVRREEAKVFSVMTYEHKGCIMCVQVEEALQPPLVLENRTSFTICFRQRGMRRVSTVFPRRRKSWTWDVPPATRQLPAEVELWALLDSVDGSATSTEKPTPAAAASCVLNFDPQQIGRWSSEVDALQGELEVKDAATGTSSLLFVRVRGVHGISYAVSITMEPTIDAYRTLPFPQFSFALHVASMYVLCRTTDKREGRLQEMLLLAMEPVDFCFAQGARLATDASQPAARRPSEDADRGDMQLIQLRFRSFQVDDERPSAKQRVVAQLVDDKESGFRIERKLLRITPILYCSVVAFWLTPVELHIEDGFITAMMRYVEEVKSSWDTLWPSKPSARIRFSGVAQECQAQLLPWQVHLEQELSVAKQFSTEAQEGSGQTLVQRPRSTVPLWSRVIAIRQLVVDSLLVSLSLYRSPGAADDPLWKLAGAASLLVGSTQDARLQWDAVQRHDVCDTIWHLLFLHRESCARQLKRQYISLVNIIGIDKVRGFVSDLLNGYSDPSNDHRGSGNSGRGAARRQKQRVPCRRAANFLFDHRTAGARSSPGVATTTLRRPGVASASANRTPGYGREAEEVPCTATSWHLRVPERAVPISAQRTTTVAEVARSYLWEDFLAVAQTPEIRAFGGYALGRALAEMQATPRYNLRCVERGGLRPCASEVVRTTLDARRRGAAGAPHPQINCSRCAELEALRGARLRSRESTPLPHPVRDGFLTWEEFAHHINWYEFVDMCTDEEVRLYASLVRQGAAEASCNVCILTSF
ncbi:N-terminal region of Chorein or VPS13/Vacuolar sorting-associated protein 13, N-terminal [Leishmania utingensis]|uniref:N-terminal region of Chorein or VPS13/Vacuolar sorting-associated protein 13, N-terminal n=1 Tax=Leishmania utingensis TaxID=653362 RepID=A0AAW3AN27_9TRYP